MKCAFIKLNILLLCLFILSSGAFSNNTSSYYRYTIKKNNTPQDIAKIFGVSLNDLKKWNPAMDRRWLYGTKIIIPVPAATVKKYIVARGDSLYSIAHKFQIPVSYLQKTLDEKFQKSLWIGASIDIPPTAKPIPMAQKPSPPKPQPQGKGPIPKKNPMYTVQKGDTYYSLARKSNVDVKTLQALNANKPLLIGNRIMLPATHTPAPLTPTKKTESPPASTTAEKSFSGKLKPPYRGPSTKYSSLISGLSYNITKTYGQSIFAPLIGSVSHVGPFVGFGTGIFISNGDTTIVLASKGFSRILAAKGNPVKTTTTIARVKYGYTLYFFRIKDGVVAPPL